MKAYKTLPLTQEEYIKVMRKRIGMTLAQFGNWAGYSPGTIQHIEAGTQHCPRAISHILLKLEKEYGTANNNAEDQAGGALRGGWHEEDHNGGAVSKTAAGAGQRGARR